MGTQEGGRAISHADSFKGTQLLVSVSFNSQATPFSRFVLILPLIFAFRYCLFVFLFARFFVCTFVDTSFYDAIVHHAIECVNKCVNFQKLSQQSRQVRPKTSRYLL